MTQQDIMGFIHEHGGEVTFAEFSKFMTGCRGAYELYVPRSNKKIIIWTGLSLPFIKLIDGMRADGKIRFTKTSKVVYSLVGITLNLPIANPKYGTYHTPHWLPVTVEIAPRKSGIITPDEF